MLEKQVKINTFHRRHWRRYKKAGIFFFWAGYCQETGMILSLFLFFINSSRKEKGEIWGYSLKHLSFVLVTRGICLAIFCVWTMLFLSKLNSDHEKVISLLSWFIPITGYSSLVLVCEENVDVYQKERKAHSCREDL